MERLEVFAGDPQTVHQHGELSSQGYGGFAIASTRAQFGGPSLPSLVIRP
jgi:hypothetical protein